MEYVKRENECCCCFSKDDLFNMLEPYNFEDKVEIYSTMIAECFQIELNTKIEECKRNLYLICKNCVSRLRDAIMLRSQVQIAYDRLQQIDLVTCCKASEDNVDIFGECSDIVETKENILRYNENDERKTPMLKPLKAILNKIDTDKIEDKTLISTKEHLKKLESTDGGKIVKIQCLDRFVCNVCNRIYKNLFYLQKHMESHADHEFACEICAKKFKLKASLMNHMLTHVDVETEKRETCGKFFISSKNTLMSHTKFNYAKSKSCHCCDKTLMNQKTLWVHLKLHLDKGELICKMCRRRFKSVRAINNHVKCHTGDRHDFICDMCKRSFKYKSSLAIHMQTHAHVKT